MNKPAMQAIQIAPGDNAMKTAVLAGDKRITIREGTRDYEVGRKLMIGDWEGEDPWAVCATITGVYHRLLEEVSTLELEADGFVNQLDMRRGMRRFYPSLDWKSHVTVVEWDKPVGSLATP